MQKIKLSLIKQVLPYAVREFKCKPLWIDARQDVLRVRFHNGIEWTLYLSALAERMGVGRKRR